MAVKDSETFIRLSYSYKKETTLRYVQAIVEDPTNPKDVINALDQITDILEQRIESDSRFGNWWIHSFVRKTD